jgi:hypothetical protein
LHVNFKENESVLINSGFYDNANIIKNLNKGEQFVLLYKTKEGQSAQFNAMAGVGEYNVATNHYVPIASDQIFISF